MTIDSEKHGEFRPWSERSRRYWSGRHQSDETDNKLPMVRCANKRLRAALIQIADNLLKCNDYFQGLAAVWNVREVDKRLQRVRIAKRFSRLAYAMVAGEQVFAHPCCRKPAYVLDKLPELQLELAVPFEEIRANMLEATNRVPSNIQRREAEPLQQIVNEIEQGKRRSGVRHISEALLVVLAKLLGESVESLTGGRGLELAESGEGSITASTPWRSTP